MTRITLGLASLALAFTAACGDDGGNTTPKDAAPKDAALIDAPPGGPDANCYANPDPNSNDQIINACTTATKIYKDSHPPLTLPDGGLAPLP